mmetsp:Transcript_8361/g.19240  ORF Transcript_8361/g.19240 Transcript_8361/m.19240 type:complete len:92 (-) Transcript_8361:227-502(-)
MAAARCYKCHVMAEKRLDNSRCNLVPLTTMSKLEQGTSTEARYPFSCYDESVVGATRERISGGNGRSPLQHGPNFACCSSLVKLENFKGPR